MDKNDNTQESSPKEQEGLPNKIPGEEPEIVQIKIGKQIDLEELIKIMEEEETPTRRPTSIQKYSKTRRLLILALTIFSMIHQS
jgi:hypothetical protein